MSIPLTGEDPLIRVEDIIGAHQPAGITDAARIRRPDCLTTEGADDEHEHAI